MGYIEDLRKLIGHKRIVLNGSLVIIENKDGKILMQKRTYPKGKWHLLFFLYRLWSAEA